MSPELKWMSYLVNRMSDLVNRISSRLIGLTELIKRMTKSVNRISSGLKRMTPEVIRMSSGVKWMSREVIRMSGEVKSRGVTGKDLCSGVGRNTPAGIPASRTVNGQAVVSSAGLARRVRLNSCFISRTSTSTPALGEATLAKAYTSSACW